jgi:hypothetical protein
MKKDFNIDAHYNRKITLLGNEHAVLPIALRDNLDGGYIFTHAREMAETDVNDTKKLIELTAGFIKHYVPTLTDEELYSMELDAFMSLYDYVKGADPDEVVEKNYLRAAAMTEAARAETTAED